MYDRNIVQSTSSFVWHSCFLYCTYLFYLYKICLIIGLFKNVYYNTILIINYCDES